MQSQSDQNRFKDQFRENSGKGGTSLFLEENILRRHQKSKLVVGVPVMFMVVMIL